MWTSINYKRYTNGRFEGGGILARLGAGKGGAARELEYQTIVQLDRHQRPSAERDRYPLAKWILPARLVS